MRRSTVLSLPHQFVFPVQLKRKNLTQGLYNKTLWTRTLRIL
jgi:hypothetical protein